MGKKKGVFRNSAHKERCLTLANSIAPYFPDLSELQLVYIAAAMTDDQMSLDAKIMVVCVGILSGPELKTPVDEEDLDREMQDGIRGALAFFLEDMAPRGNA